MDKPINISYLRELLTKAVNIYSSVEDACAVLRSNLPPIAYNLGIGSLTISLDAPKSFFACETTQYVRELFSSENLGTDSEHFKYMTPEKGVVSIDVVSSTGVTWSDEDRNNLKFVCEIILIVASRVRISELLTKNLFSDPLTDCLQLSRFMSVVREKCENGTIENYTACYFDIQNFGHINIHGGQAAGDSIICEFASALKQNLGEDEYISRVGGDNFVILVRKENFLSFILFFEKSSFTYEGTTYTLSCRYGIYDCKAEDSPSDIFEGSNLAHVVARQKGVRVMRFDDKMKQQDIKTKEAIAYFRDALKNGEYIVYYQPKVSARGRRLCGCEALVRWERNNKMIPPMDFLPALELDENICLLDMYVFECVCKDIRNWLDKGLTPVKTSVNFSKHHFSNPNFAKKLIELMTRYNIGSKYIEIEITETVLSNNYEEMLPFINTMRAFGVVVSIDDFGTGSSSLGMFSNLPVDIVKLDRSFIWKFDTKAGKVVAKNIISMLCSLNLTVLAEGVETREQADFLESIGCDIYQGFYFDKPLSHDVFETRLRGEVDYSLR